MTSRARQTRSVRAAVLIIFALAPVVACRQPSPWVLPEPTAPTPRPDLVDTRLVSPAATENAVPTSTASPAPTSTPSLSETPEPATPVPTANHVAMSATVTSAVAAIGGTSIAPLCLRWEDLDVDGVPEWVGVYEVVTQTRSLAAFVLDDGVWYDLAPIPASKYGLGDEPVCRLEVRDVNLDGRQEIMVWGRAGTDTDLLHLFAWNGYSYEIVASFEGNAGIEIEEWDGQLGEEIVVGHRVSKDLIWQVIYAWDGVAYGWRWDRHAWFLSSRPHVYDTSTAERAVISFYLAIDDRDLPGAYRLLAAAGDSGPDYDEWTAGFATTVGVEASAVQEIQNTDEETSVISAQVLARDNADGRIVATLWDVVWTVVRSRSGWRLASVSSSLLDSWELGR